MPDSDNVHTGNLGMSRPIRILSIDGGGIRGIIPGQLLYQLEQRLQRLTDNPEARIADCFDLIAGTSTGGIIACLLLCPHPENRHQPRYSARDVLSLYIDHGGEIFDIPLGHRIRSAGGTIDEKYPADGIEGALEEYLGDLWLSELVKSCLVTSYDIQRRQAHFFTKHGAQANQARDFRVRDVARATSAAPTYFETAQIRSRSDVPYTLIDGGVFANNPALCAYAEVRAGFARAHHIIPPARASGMMILSLGTGRVDSPYSYEEAKDWGIINWLRPLMDIIMTGVSETVDYQLRQIYDAVGVPEQYLRIEPHIDAHEVNNAMDDATPENIAALRDLGREVYKHNQEPLERFLDRLIRPLVGDDQSLVGSD